jgi:hypothetical protein
MTLRLIPDEPALLLRSGGSKTLVLSDLHLGFERELAARGVNLPSQMTKLLERALDLVERYSPRRILLLGDVKHAIPGISPQEYAEVPEFLRALEARVEEITLVPGNHDGDLGKIVPRGIQIASSRGVLVRDGRRRVALLHGHAWPEAEMLFSDVLVLGHTHPVVEFREPSGLRKTEPVWVFCRWDRETIAAAYLKFLGKREGENPLETLQGRFGGRLRNAKVLIMPAFNPLLGGQVVNGEEGTLLGPLFTSGGVDLERAELTLLDGTYLGTLSDLREGPKAPG